MSEEKEIDGAKEEVIVEFDPKAFKDTPAIVETVDNPGTEGKVEDKVDDGEDKPFSWGDDIIDEDDKTLIDDKKTDDDDDTVIDDKTDKVKDEVIVDDKTDDKKDEIKDPVPFEGSLTDDHYVAFAKELGIEANSLDELKTALKTLETENEQLKSTGTVTNDKITKLQGYKKLSTEELVRKDLEAQGFKGDELETTLDTLKDNGMLDIEARKINNAIDKAVELEKNSLTQRSQEEDAKQLASRDKNVKELQTYLGTQDEMFGFKMAKDEESLVKVRDDHHKYITSGSYLNEITKDNQSLAESAFLWKNRKVLFNALKNNGLQQGRAEVLNDLGLPDDNKTVRLPDPGGKGEFDPKKFRTKAKK